MTIEEKVAAHESICRRMTELYRKKNHDYGDSFSRSFSKYGWAATLVKLEEKVGRLEQLTYRKQKPLVQDESITDTLLDIANYAILTLIELKMQEE